MTTPDLLDRLERIKAEADRALAGLKDGRIPKGTSALHKIRYEAVDALDDASDEEFSRSPEATVIP